MLGTDLASILEEDGNNVKVFDLPYCDLTNPEHVSNACKGVDTVVNCAAYTQVDKAEDEPELACKVNALAVENLGRLIRDNDQYLIQISTDFVFDGAGSDPYTETDEPRPLSVYGSTKLEGELLLAGTGCKHAIVRVQWSYGANGDNFISKLVTRAKGNAPLKVVDDQIGAPTWTRDMAQALKCLLKKRHEGLYHFANTGYASRYDVARFILDALDMDNELTPCSSDEFPMKAARPKNSRFALDKIQKHLDFEIRPWQMALAEYLRYHG